MRIPLKGSDSFCGRLNSTFEKLSNSYLQAIQPEVQMQSLSAMLADGTVTKVNSFDPQRVKSFYRRLSRRLGERGWATSDISESKTEDLCRLYFTLSKAIGKYYMAGYFGIQFHMLPYYRVDKRVIGIQKELAKIAEDASGVFQTMSGAADKALQAELEKKGYADLEFQELFTKMFEDEKLIQELDSKATAVETQFPQFEKMRRDKVNLFAELNDLLMELYQTSPVLIDYNRLMQGEEGVTVYFDIEVITSPKAGKRDAYVNTSLVPPEWSGKVAAELAAVEEILQ